MPLAFKIAIVAAAICLSCWLLAHLIDAVAPGWVERRDAGQVVAAVVLIVFIASVATAIVSTCVGVIRL